MAKKEVRKDSKGYVLKTGECQRTDEILRNNPSDMVMCEIKKSRLWLKPKRHALTIPQQKAFLSFLENNDEYMGWYPIITVLLGTGMRIGECSK